MRLDRPASGRGRAAHKAPARGAAAPLVRVGFAGRTSASLPPSDSRAARFHAPIRWFSGRRPRPGPGQMIAGKRRLRGEILLRWRKRKCADRPGPLATCMDMFILGCKLNVSYHHWLVLVLLKKM
jgi:hypothetical protein